MKKILCIIVTLSILMCTIVVSAEEPNLERMDRAKCSSTMQSICSAIINSDEQLLLENTAYFETSAYQSVFNFIEKDSIQGSIIDNSIEFTYPDKSSTGDSVIMMNYKLSIGNGYNVIYLFEFHINSNGKIYGFNAWEY